MQTVRLENGLVVEVIPPADLPLEERFTPDFVATLRAAPDDVAPGWRWDGEEFAPPPVGVTPAQARADRNARIAASDWTQLADAPLTAEQRAAWAAYRAALRAVTEQPGFPDDITWPEAPA